MAVVWQSLWITGGSRTGKTTRLVEQFCLWSQMYLGALKAPYSAPFKPKHPLQGLRPLVLAANGTNKRHLVDRITQASAGQYPFSAITIMGFFQQEVLLFWPLLIEALDLRAQFPQRLRPELEQELASQLWSPEIDSGKLTDLGKGRDRIVRTTLDLLQLAALSGTPVEDLPSILERHEAVDDIPETTYTCMTEMLLRWQNWCQQKGLLTYGIIADLYWPHLLKHPTYQKHLLNQHRVILADDVDEYPAIARHVFEFLLENQVMGAFTYNPQGAVRLGLGADPKYLAQLQDRCQIEQLSPVEGLAKTLGTQVVSWINQDYGHFPDLSNSQQSVFAIETTSRAELLRRTATTIIEAIKNDEVQPQDIAIIAPGLDAIARYSIREILTHEGIALEEIQPQQPLITSSVVRSLLILLALVYPGLGRLVDRDAIAEMLTIISSHIPESKHSSTSDPDSPAANFPIQNAIDPVRAGLLADHCFALDVQNPKLLPINTFPRWDRLGYRAANTYKYICEWLALQQQQYHQNLLPSPVALLERAIQEFFLPRATGSSYLIMDMNRPALKVFAQIDLLRELMETAIHFWNIYTRDKPQPSPLETVEITRQFIELLRRGVVTANPYPMGEMAVKPHRVTLATIFQYRVNHQSHSWHFWLDVASPLWFQEGASSLWGAPLFLRDIQQQRQPWTSEDMMAANQQRLQRIVWDLLSRVSDRLYLCHSELSVNGQEQLGPLLPLVNSVQYAPRPNL
ncbi:MAG: recombinase family protein [Limnospira maxima]